MCAKKAIEKELINDIETSKSRPIINLKSVSGTENFPWLYDTGAQATCLSEKLFRKIPINIRPPKVKTNRIFVGAGGQPLQPVGVYVLPFTWTDRKGNSLTVQHEVVVMKDLNSGAIMGMDLIRSLGIVYFNQSHEFHFEKSWTDKRPFEVGEIVTSQEMFLPAHSSQSVRVSTKQEGFKRHCPQITSIAEIHCKDYKQIMGPQGVVIPDHQGKIVIVLQNCSDVDVKCQEVHLLATLKIQVQKKNTLSKIMNLIQKN